ncbi:MAG: ABC transporter ATP-binding protein [Lentisphaeria bacterium]|nr:ABC transporter ATP-binding protein [Lentisphaeria bacterium]NQZ68524.1 ABC transporter ATP-binding protein [Lentisphaeria bacterium]
MSDDDDIIISSKNVTKVYGKGDIEVHALRGITLDIVRGEYISIMGPSGSGKSTFFNMIGGLDTPTEGHVSIDGFRLSELNSKQLAWVRCNRIGFIFQSFNLIETMTCLENVAIARIFKGAGPDQANEEAKEVLTRVGLGHRLDHLPTQVSGGQMQRIAIARALVNKPKIILADEPTGNLDLKTGQQVIDLLQELKTELHITIISATHDKKMLSSSDRVVWIKDGAIERVANKDELDISIGMIDGETVL